MPLGIVLCMLTLVVLSAAVLVCTVGVGPSPEAAADALSPMAYGLAKVFDVSERYVYILIIPAVLATTYSFLFACGRQVLAMAESGLYPAFLRRTVANKGIPYMALICPSVLGYGVLLLTWQFTWLHKVFFNICIAGSYISYLASFFSFISFRLFFPGLDKKFTYRSPLGLTGACVGILVFTCSLLSVAGFQNDGGLAILVIVCYLALSSVYYFASAKKRQRFSSMEKSVMMIAHVIKGKLTEQYSAV
jgi:amino acid permease